VRGFIIGLAVSFLIHAAAVKAQEPTPLSVPDCDQPAQFRNSICPVVIHEHDLTVKEILEILSEYDVRHVDQQPLSMPAYGATTFETNPPTIYIFNTADLRSKKSTLIHEFTHVHCRNIAVDCPDEYVRFEEDRQFQKLFGVQ
jgi:hypothetical protein